jgi:hypothetical protein
MTISTISAGWRIAFLRRDSDGAYTYYLLDVVGLALDRGEVDPVVMLPTGQTSLASQIPDKAFAVGPDDDATKIARAHAAQNKYGTWHLQTGPRDVH